MNGPRNTEPQANHELAHALRRRNPDWTDDTVHAERTNVLQLAVPGSGAARRPDILISPPRRQAVTVETEFAPARTVGQDATARLGTRLHSTGAEIEGTLSVVLPEHLRTGDLATIEGAAFHYATHYMDAKGDTARWPPPGEWLQGGVDELADAIEYLSLSERQLARGTEALEEVVRNAAELLAEHAGQEALARIASDLHQEAGRQTERMAAAICVSAFMFHAAVEGQEGIPPSPLAGSIDKATLLGVNGHRKYDTSGHGKCDTFRNAPRRERSDRSGAFRKDLVGAHHRVPPCSERSAETAREAVGWMALESSAWRRIR